MPNYLVCPLKNCKVSHLIIYKSTDVVGDHTPILSLNTKQITEPLQYAKNINLNLFIT